MAAAYHYTRFVLFGRRLLWLLIFGMLALLVWIATDNSGNSGKRLVFTNAPQMEEVRNVMEKPHYQGLDEQNRPYTIIADRAVQADADNVTLQTLRADMMQGNGKWVALNAKNGAYNTKTKRLDLTNSVSLFYEGGYEMRTERAEVDVHSGSAYGDTFVEGQGPAGTLEADSFHVFDRGKVIRFTGSVKMKIYPE